MESPSLRRQLIDPFMFEAATDRISAGLQHGPDEPSHGGAEHYRRNYAAHLGLCIGLYTLALPFCRSGCGRKLASSRRH